MVQLAGWLVLASLSWGQEATFEELTARDDWKPLADRRTEYGAIQVYLAYLGKVPCLRAVAELPITPLQLMDVIADIEGALTWGDDALKVSEVVRSGTGWAVWQQQAELPSWSFLNDRFWFLHGTFEERGDTWVLRWVPAVGSDVDTRRAAVMAADDAAVEPPVNYGGWTVKPAPGGLVGRYEICVDGGGAIPMSLQRFATTSTIPKGLEDLVREAKRREAAGIKPSMRWLKR
jgi:hypothetical protein